MDENPVAKPLIINRWMINHWRKVLTWSFGLGLILGVTLASAKAITGHDFTEPLFHTLFHVCKIMIVAADVLIFYACATTAWRAYKFPEAPTLPEAAQKVRSLAMMIGGLLLLFVTQLFLFRTA